LRLPKADALAVVYADPLSQKWCTTGLKPSTQIVGRSISNTTNRKFAVPGSRDLQIFLAPVPSRSIPRIAQCLQFGQPHRIVGCERFFEMESICDIAHYLLRITTIFRGDNSKGVDQFAEEALV
jgi:hypothetical protein